MIRTLLASTALAAILSTGAIAQDAVPAAPTVAATSTATGAGEPWDMSAGYAVADTDNLGTRLIGQPVYSTAGDDAEEIGNISDLVFSDDGQITAVVIGVGGFLGAGEKNVAVDFGALDFTIASDNTERWVLPTTAEALTAAPDFVWADDVPADAMAPGNTDAMAPAKTDAMAPVTPTVGNDGSGSAPMAIPRDGYNAVEVDALTTDNITGAMVVGPDGDDIASVGDILLTQDGKVDAMLIDFGGFLGLGQKTVAVGMENLDFATNENGDILVYSDFTREQLEAAPEYDAAAYATTPAMRATDK